MDLTARLSDGRAFVDNLLEKYLKRYEGERLYESVSYSLFAGGKRLRPIMMLETLKMAGVKIDEAARLLMAALECMHTYTLVHDDLPCMDNDDLRRGKPSCHKKFGEAAALLTGDALLNLSFEFSLEAVSEGGASALGAAKVLAGLGGMSGVIGGQALELSLPKTRGAFRGNIDEIYFKKTAYLLSAPVIMGLIMAGAKAETVEEMTRFANAFGYGYQIVDDLLDLKEKGESLFSYVWIYGRTQAAETARINIAAAKASLNKTGLDTSFFQALCDYSLSRDC